MRGFLVGMSRRAKVAVMVANDGLSLLLALWLSLSLRYGDFWVPQSARQLACFGAAAASGVIAFGFGGLYRWMVRYVSAQTLLVIFRALLVSALVYLWGQGALDWGTRGRVTAPKARSGSDHV